MTRGVGAGLLACAGLLLAAAPPALAGPTTEDEREADRLDKVGKDAFRSGAYDDAAIAFKAAWEADPTPGRLYNLGKAYQRAGDLERAIATYQRYLDEVPDAEDAQQVEEGIDFLRVKLERTKVPLEVTTYPDGATLGIECGDTRVGGTTPWSGWLLPGPCRVRIDRDGYQTVTQELTLVLDDPQDLQVVLKPPPKDAPPPKDPNDPKDPGGPKGPGGSPPGPEGPPLLPLEVWGAFGGAAAALVASGVLFGVSQAKLADYDDWRKGTQEHSREEVEETGQTARTLGIVSVAALGVAVAAGAAGGVLLYLSNDGGTVGFGGTW